MKPGPGVLVPVLILVAALLAIAGGIAFGGPTPPAPMATVNDPFKSVDFSDLPPLLTFQASDGQPLAYREYVPVGVQRGSVTLIHGSSARSNSMHPMAKALAAAGYKAFALDMRGHGQSGAKGHIRHIGQLDSDLADFVRTVHPPQPSTLAGFSSGGGFVLRFAGGDNQSLFGSYLLLSPFLSENAANQRPGSGGWVKVGVPRVVGLAVLNSFGIDAFNGLPVVSFALNEQARAFLTPEYDFNLAMNFRPERDFVANIQRVAKPCAVLAGAADESFRTEKLEEIFRAASKRWEVELLPDVGHIPLTLEPSALAAVVRHVRKLQQAV